VTFGTTEPDVSVILPVSAPVETACAMTAGAIARNRQLTDQENPDIMETWKPRLNVYGNISLS